MTNKNLAIVDAVKVKTILEEISPAELYDQLVEQAIAVREKADELAWRLGEIALNITTHFGAKALKDFARDIRIKYATLRRYRDVVKAYPEWRELIARFKLLSWTHFRGVAARPDKIKLLERASDENWSCEKMEKMTKPNQEDIIDDGKHVPPRPELIFDLQIRLWYIGNKMDDARYVIRMNKLKKKK